MKQGDILEQTGIQNSLWSEMVIGQEGLWAHLLDSVNNKTLPHLSLLSGKPGQGQLILALALSQALLCENQMKPCGQCNACKQSHKLIHPDLHFSFPLSKAKETCQQYYGTWRTAVQESPFMGISEWFLHFEEESKNANIPVSEVENIVSLLHLKPFVADIKVLIIWLPEYLGKESNRLLKLFEEPPEGSYIILVSEHSEMLLSTVQSRAQLFRLGSIPYDRSADYLAKQLSVTTGDAYSAIVSSEGNIQEAIHYLQDKAMARVETLQHLLQSVYQYQAQEMVNWVEQFTKISKEEQKYFLVWMQRILSFVLRWKYSKNEDENQIQSSLTQYVRKLSSALRSDQIEKINILLDDALIAIQRNANVKILMTDFCIQLAHITRSKLN
ncbi:MAG: hypothetical protein IPM34_04500 [Saprospiraceae bacterium]|nr:hypothetical protein [Saprospiraceae bacterium]